MRFRLPATRLGRAALACALALLAAPLAAQESLPPAAAVPAPADSAAVPGAELTVYLITMGQGDAVWEKFGHNAIRIVDRLNGTDVSYNWGLFDFGAADFLPRFLKGSMRYWMAPFPTGPMVAAYAETDRDVWQQELALTPAERRALRDFVEWNAREENAYYTYDYFRDNCSTRVRDALDRVLGGRLKARFDTVAAGTSYRWHTRRLTQETPLVYTGMDLVLGQPGDQAIAAWDEMFLPMRLREYVRGVTVAGPDGRSVPLVVAETRLYESRRGPEPLRPASPLPAFLAAGAALGLLFAGLAHAAARGSRGAARGFTVAGVLWSALVGIVGVIMVLTWTATDHVFMYRNENLLQFTPLSLLLAALLPGLVRRRAGDAAFHVAAAVALLALLGLVLQALPAFSQTNGAEIALALPAHLGLLWGVWRLRRAPEPVQRQAAEMRAAA